jgi:ABC-type microcin C transport system permease subunit YejB
VKLLIICFAHLKFKMTEFDFHAEVTILIADFVKAMLQVFFFAAVLVKLLIYLNTMLSLLQFRSCSERVGSLSVRLYSQGRYFSCVLSKRLCKDQVGPVCYTMSYGDVKV